MAPNSEPELKGKLYEKFLFMHTLFNDNNTNFDIGIEVKHGGKFDDLAIRENSEKGEKHTYLQIKLVNSVDDAIPNIDSKVLLGEKCISLHPGDFKLEKYFLSYLRIKDQLSSCVKKYRLIIFTNAGFDVDDITNKIGRVVTKEINAGDVISSELSKHPNNTPCYVVTDLKSDFRRKLKSSVISDIDNLATELMKYATPSDAKKPPMTLDTDLFKYYNSALVNEVVEIEKPQKGRGLLGKFKENFVLMENLSERALKLRQKITEGIERNISKDEYDEKVKDLMSNSKWKVSNDFRSNVTEIKLPNYDIVDGDIDDFFEILEFRINQLEVVEVRNKIKDETIRKKLMEWCESDPNFALHTVSDYIDEIKKAEKNKTGTDEGWFLHKNREKHIDFLKSEFSKPTAKLYTKEYIQHLEKIRGKYGILFQDDCLFEKEDLMGKIVVIRTVSTALTSLKIIQSLGTEDLIFVDLQRLPTLRVVLRLIEAFSGNDCEKLILSYNRAISRNLCFEWSMKLQKCIENAHKQICLITSVSEYEDDFVGSFTKCTELEDKTVNLKNLQDYSKILEHALIVQGNPIKLSDCIHGKEGSDLISTEIINHVINGDEIIIGKKPLGASNLEGAYSELYVELSVKILVENLLLLSSETIYLISGCGTSKSDTFIEYLTTYAEKSKMDELKNIIEVCSPQSINTIRGSMHKRVKIVVDLKNEIFKKICQNNEQSTIYWMHVNEKDEERNAWKFTLRTIYNPNFYLSSERFEVNCVDVEKIKEHLVNSQLAEIFMLAGMENDDVAKWFSFTTLEIESFLHDGKIILSTLENSTNNFEQLTVTKPDHTIHFLEFNNDHLRWVNTYGSTYEEFESTKMSTKIVNEEELIKTIEHAKIAIFAGDPGIGKSTTLFKLYESKNESKSGEMLSLSETHWLIKYNFRSHLSKLRHLDFDDEDDENGKSEKIVELLYQVIQFEENGFFADFTRKILGMALDSENFVNPLLLVFDGFDEVLEENQRAKIISILGHLKLKNVKFWISTRMHFKDLLEIELSTNAVVLQPMDYDATSEFVKKYFENRLEILMSRFEFARMFDDDDDDDDLRGPSIWDYIDPFRMKMNEVFDGVRDFMGTPLQLYLMLDGTVVHFLHWVSNYTKNGDVDFEHLGADTWKIMDNFIARKYETYFKKIEIEEKIRQDQEKLTFDHHHENLAKAVILGGERKDVRKFKDLMLLSGITKSDGYSLQFIHPTLMEFFACKVFINWMTKESGKFSNRRKNKFLLSKILIDRNYKFIRVLLNIKLREILQDENMHKQLESNLKLFGKIYVKLWYNRNKREKSILQTAADERNQYIVTVLVDMMAAVDNSKDLLFDYLQAENSYPEYSILHYCVRRFNDDHILLVLLAKAAHHLTQKQIFDLLICKNAEQGTILHAVTCRILDDDSIYNPTQSPSSMENTLMVLMKCVCYLSKALYTGLRSITGALAILNFAASHLSPRNLFVFLMIRDKSKKTALDYVIGLKNNIVTDFLPIAASTFSAGPELLFLFLYIQEALVEACYHENNRLSSVIVSIIQSHLTRKQIFQLLKKVRGINGHTALFYALASSDGTETVQFILETAVSRLSFKQLCRLINAHINEGIVSLVGYRNLFYSLLGIARQKRKKSLIVLLLKRFKHA